MCEVLRALSPEAVRLFRIGPLRADRTDVGRHGLRRERAATPARPTSIQSPCARAVPTAMTTLRTRLSEKLTTFRARLTTPRQPQLTDEQSAALADVYANCACDDCAALRAE